MFANPGVTRFCLALCLAFASGAALAGSFKVAPIKLFFDVKAKSTVLRVINKDQEKATLQLEAFKWTQDERGADQYVPTQDIVFFPKIRSTTPCRRSSDTRRCHTAVALSLNSLRQS